MKLTIVRKHNLIQPILIIRQKLKTTMEVFLTTEYHMPFKRIQTILQFDRLENSQVKNKSIRTMRIVHQRNQNEE